MAMPTPVPLLPDLTRRDWTANLVNALPDDGNRYEVIDGELLVTPAPSLVHQRAVGELYLAVKPYADLHALDCVVSPAAVTFSLRREVQPDLFVLPTLDGRFVRRFTDVGRLVLAVEVISPSSARTDRNKKRMLYQSEGVPEYWIVDPEARFVERWRQGDEAPEVLAASIAWLPHDVAEPLEINLSELFRRVHGE